MPVFVGVEVWDFASETKYALSKKVKDLMHELWEYEDDDSVTSYISELEDDFVFIKVPLKYVAEFTEKDLKETVEYLANEYLPSEFEDFPKFLREEKHFDVENGFDNEVQNGYEKIESLEKDLTEMLALAKQREERNEKMESIKIEKTGKSKGQEK